MKFTTEEMLELQKNPNIVRCSQKAITYSKDFKLRAVKQYLEGDMYAFQIFKRAGFNIDLIGRNIIKGNLGRWKKKYKKNGEAGLLFETRGHSLGRQNNKQLSPTSKNSTEYLEAQIAYLKAENDFLTQLRAARGE